PARLPALRGDARKAGVDLAREPPVGVGSVCRRQPTAEIEVVFHTLASLGLRLHGLGVKTGGLARYADCLGSADSLAWSFRRGGRRLCPAAARRPSSSTSLSGRWAAPRSPAPAGR